MTSGCSTCGSRGFTAISLAAQTEVKAMGETVTPLAVEGWIGGEGSGAEGADTD